MTQTPDVVVLYEDKATGPTKDYGPHKLVVQCVADALAVEPWSVRGRIEGIPRAGYANIRKDCTVDPLKLGRRGVHVVAVYDFDKIHRLVQLPPSACKPALRSKLYEGCAFRERLTIVFLDRNLETILEALCARVPHMVTDEQRRRAVERKDPATRDVILGAAAAPSPAGRAAREGVLAAVPSLAYLVDKLVLGCRSSFSPGE